MPSWKKKTAHVHLLLQTAVKQISSPSADPLKVLGTLKHGLLDIHAALAATNGLGQNIDAALQFLATARRADSIKDTSARADLIVRMQELSRDLSLLREAYATRTTMLKSLLESIDQWRSDVSNLARLHSDAYAREKLGEMLSTATSDWQRRTRPPSQRP